MTPQMFDELLNSIDAPLPLERTMIVNRRGEPVGTLSAPSKPIVQEVRKAATARLALPCPTVAVHDAAARLERVWTEGVNAGRSGTTMRRAVMKDVAGTGDHYLGAHVSPRVIGYRYEFHPSLDPLLADAATWFNAAMDTRCGSLDTDEWRLDLTIEPDKVGTTHDVHLTGVRVTAVHVPSGAGTSAVFWLDLTAAPPVLYDTEVREWEQHHKEGTAEVHSMILLFLEQAHVRLMRGHWRPANSYYVPRCAKATALGASSEWVGGGPQHIVARKPLTVPADALAERFDVMHQDVVSGTSHGVIAAGDVGPCTYMAYGQPAGRGVGLAALRLWIDGRPAYHVTARVTSHHRPLYLDTKSVRSPCVRDGLLSASLVNRMTGYGDGYVGIDFLPDGGAELKSYKTRTAWAMLTNRQTA